MILFNVLDCSSDEMASAELRAIHSERTQGVRRKCDVFDVVIVCVSKMNIKANLQGTRFKSYVETIVCLTFIMHIFS
jgi:hypothetical protein